MDSFEHISMSTSRNSSSTSSFFSITLTSPSSSRCSHAFPTPTLDYFCRNLTTLLTWNWPHKIFAFLKIRAPHAAHEAQSTFSRSNYRAQRFCQIRSPQSDYVSNCWQLPITHNIRIVADWVKPIDHFGCQSIYWIKIVACRSIARYNRSTTFYCRNRTVDGSAKLYGSADCACLKLSAERIVAFTCTHTHRL